MTAFQLRSTSVIALLALFLLVRVEAQVCWKIPGSTGTPAVNGICQCYSQFYWIPAQQSCVINCTTVANSTGTPLLADFCVCKTDFRFVQLSSGTWACVPITCANITYAVHSSPYTAQACTCIAGWVWDLTKRDCIVDCDNTLNALNVPIGNTACQCELGFMWEVATLSCETLLCSSVAFSNGPDPASSGAACLCLPGYSWNVATTQCNLLC